MLRVAAARTFGSAVVSSALVAPRLSASPAVAMATPAMTAIVPVTAMRGIKTDKMIAGAIGATISSTVVIGTFHLIVAKVPLMVAAGTIVGSGLSGVLAAFEGGEGGNSGAFGSAIGIFLGCIGAYYAKTSTEPWRK
jgi:hypothetical protein